MTDSPRPSSQPAAIPADHPKRNLALVRPDDPNLPHTGLVGDTYTVLLTGKDTAGRYCLIDMHVPPSFNGTVGAFACSGAGVLDPDGRQWIARFGI